MKRTFVAWTAVVSLLLVLTGVAWGQEWRTGELLTNPPDARATVHLIAEDHASPEVQRRVYQLITELAREDGATTLVLEGSYPNYDADGAPQPYSLAFWQPSDRRTGDAVLAAVFSGHGINASDYAALRHELQVFGVEDAAAQAAFEEVLYSTDYRSLARETGAVLRAVVIQSLANRWADYGPDVRSDIRAVVDATHGRKLWSCAQLSEAAIDLTALDPDLFAADVLRVLSLGLEEGAIYDPVFIEELLTIALQYDVVSNATDELVLLKPTAPSGVPAIGIPAADAGALSELTRALPEAALMRERDRRMMDELDLVLQTGWSQDLVLVVGAAHTESVSELLIGRGDVSVYLHSVAATALNLDSVSYTERASAVLAHYVRHANWQPPGTFGAWVDEQLQNKDPTRLVSATLQTQVMLQYWLARCYVESIRSGQDGLARVREEYAAAVRDSRDAYQIDWSAIRQDDSVLHVPVRFGSETAVCSIFQATNADVVASWRPSPGTVPSAKPTVEAEDVIAAFPADGALACRVISMPSDATDEVFVHPPVSEVAFALTEDGSVVRFSRGGTVSSLPADKFIGLLETARWSVYVELRANAQRILANILGTDRLSAADTTILLTGDESMPLSMLTQIAVAVAPQSLAAVAVGRDQGLARQNLLRRASVNTEPDHNLGLVLSEESLGESSVLQEVLGGDWGLSEFSHSRPLRSFPEIGESPDVFIAAGHASEPFRSMLERAGSEHRLRGKLIIAGTCDAEELSSDLVQHLIHEHGAVGVLAFDRVVVAQAIRLLIGEMDNLLGELSQPIGAVEFFRRSLESAIRRAESGEPDYAPLVDELRNLRNYYYRVSRRIHGGEPLWAA